MIASTAVGSAGPAAQRAPSVTPFEEVYVTHAASVHRFCLSQVGDVATAEDLTHETFVRAFNAYDRVRPDAQGMRAWLISIARNLGRDHHRRGSRWRLVSQRLQRMQPPPSGVEERAEQRAELRRVTAVLSTLRSRERELIGLRVAADLTYSQIAEVLGSSEPVVKVATHRALTKLRNRLEEPA